jgi:hypothetical protein
MRGRLNHRDMLFIVETLMPGRADREHSADRLTADEAQLETMLDDNRLFQRLMRDENILLQISPWLFFTVLLRRAWRDLEREAFTVEQRGRQKVVLFDADRVVQLLAQEPVRDYLATMLASFTRVESVTVLAEVKPGAWRGYRTNELNIEGMMRYSQTLDESFRFAPYKRIADGCLFLTGMFTEYINGQYRYPLSGQLRPRMRSRLCQQVEDYEAYGQAFYQMAAEHELAKREGLDEVLITLSENFILAEKPLAFMASRYLQFTRHTLFEL